MKTKLFVGMVSIMASASMAFTVYGRGLMLGNNEQLDLKEERLSSAYIEFETVVSEGEIIQLLQRHDAMPKAVFMQAGEFSGTHRAYDAKSAQVFLGEARATSIESFSKSLKDNQFQLQRVAEKHTKEEIIESDYLQREVQSLLNLRASLETALTTVQRDEPLIFSMQVSGDPTQLAQLGQVAIVKTFEQGSENRRVKVKVDPATVAEPRILPIWHTYERGKTFYPNYGTLYYDGTNFAGSQLRWNNPGNWTSHNPGYEHDFVDRSWNYFKSCTSWSNLPYGYDDCVTTGYFENSGLSFSFGTYDATKIIPWKTYYGFWSFNGGYLPTAKFYLSGQEVEHSFCPWNNPWCMGNIRATNLIEGITLNRGQYLFLEWNR